MTDDRIKFFEVRDRATFIPVLCIKLQPERQVEEWLLRRAGFGPPFNFVQMISLISDGKGYYDPYKWGTNPRTYHEAHRYIGENWDSLETGQVIDVEYILGETEEIKVSEKLL